MSVATITPVPTSRTLLNLTAALQAATAADFFATTGSEILAIQNNNGATDVTLTITPGKTYDGQALAAKTYTIPHTSAPLILIGPFNPSVWGDVTGNVALTYSSTTSIVVGVVKPGSP